MNDPETFKLSKSQVIEVINRRIIEWKKNWKENKFFILEGYVVRGLISKADPKKFEGFWLTLIKDIDNLRYENEKVSLPDQFKLQDMKKPEITLDFTRILK